MSGRGAVVVVMARSPRGGSPPKTRLASVVADPGPRRRLYAAFLADTLAACRTVRGAEVRVAHAGGGPDGFAGLGLTPDQLLPQRGEDLGAREWGVFTDLFRDGFSPVVMIGSDLPTLPIGRVSAAIARLRAQPDQVVLGPAEDGGYYLMGLASRPGAPAGVPDLFTGIRWSTAWALDDTLAAAARAGLAATQLEPWYDVDDPADLARLRQELATADGAARAPATRAVLDELFRTTK